MNSHSQACCRQHASRQDAGVGVVRSEHGGQAAGRGVAVAAQAKKTRGLPELPHACPQDAGTLCAGFAQARLRVRSLRPEATTPPAQPQA